MPNKSRHNRGKHSFQSKKKGQRITPVTVAQEQTAPPAGPAATPTHTRIATPRLSAPAPATTSHPHIAAELRRIGILAGIMLAVLVVLAFTLP
ncbi:MAG: hypothetical protein PHY18_03900 [Dehalococcoidales bacterium]|nr:hypothetical protein [Dehalococcoidales bacterium]